MVKANVGEQFVNEVIATGKVIAVKDEERRCSLRIVTKNGSFDAFPLFYCTKEQIKGLRVGDHVFVNGHVESFFSKKDKSVNHRQCFVADGVEKAMTMCEAHFGIKGKFWETPSIKIYIAGKFSSQNIRSDGWMSLVVQISDKANDVVKLNMKKLDRQPEATKGDMVYVCCGLSTQNKTFGDKKYHYDNIVVSDIAISPAENK